MAHEQESTTTNTPTWPLLAVVGAAALGAAAFWWLRARQSGTADGLLNVCERVARELESRLADSDRAIAV